MKTVKDTSAEYKAYIESYFEEHCFSDPSLPQQRLFSAMRYSLLAGGKRLRPILVFAFCKLCGGDWKKAVNFAAAVEMIHTYSLIHDDLPCMDDDDYRRGKPTNHKLYGEAMAVLAGDGLLTAAFHQISLAPMDAQLRIRAVGVLAEAAGELGMVGGQALDIMSEERACTKEEVLEIQSRKTGALIKAACMLGVIAAGGSDEQIQSAEAFAENLGLAFQIRDDILDVIGNQEELGKATGVDGQKNTFVRLYGLEKCESMVIFYTNQALAALSIFEDTGYLSELAESLTGRTS